ncbi:unnamed protein product [Cochlearia groenlandica]
MLLTSSQIEGKSFINNCNESGLEVLKACEYSLDKKLPAPPTPRDGCCPLLRNIGMQCVCEAITKVTEASYDMQKLVNVALACGRPLLPGSQCGSYRVPSA